MSSADTVAERRHSRRFAGNANSGRLKGNKITVSNDGKSKPLKTRKVGDTDITVESPEFQLLVRLYVPAKLLIKNNKVLKKQLANYLPVIVNESLPELNFELHIFLSSIVTAYVASWYLSKLNTDDFEFVESVYAILCDFVKDFARRLLSIVELPNMLDLVDEWARILDGHIRLVQLENGNMHMVNEFLERSRSCVRPDGQLTLDELIDQILLETHIIFSHEKQHVEPNSDDEGSIHIFEEPEDNLLNYLRVTTRNVLLVAFKPEESALVGQGPRTSAIAMNLLTIIIADLVFGNIIKKLSTPQFLLATVGGKLTALIEEKLSQPKTPDTTPLYKRITSKFYRVYIGVSGAAIALGKLVSPQVSEHKPSILYSPLFSLADAITNASERFPVVTNLAKIGRTILLSTQTVSRRFEAIARSYLAGGIRRSPLLEDKFLASIVNMLTTNVFSRTDSNNDEKQPIESIEDLTAVWFNLLTSDLVPFSLLKVAFQGESDEDIRKSIEQFFALFDSESTNHSGPFSPSSKLNKLLAIQVFDSIVQNVYPELVVTGATVQEDSDPS